MSIRAYPRAEQPGPFCILPRIITSDIIGKLCLSDGTVIGATSRHCDRDEGTAGYVVDGGSPKYIKPGDALNTPEYTFIGLRDPKHPQQNQSQGIVIDHYTGGNLDSRKVLDSSLHGVFLCGLQANQGIPLYFVELAKKSHPTKIGNLSASLTPMATHNMGDLATRQAATWQVCHSIEVGRSFVIGLGHEEFAHVYTSTMD
jgi:hypothetical protein